MLFRRFGAWTLQRQEEKHALKDTNNPVYLRRRKLTKKKKLVAREVEEKKRRAVEWERREAEQRAVVDEAPNGKVRRHQQDQYLVKKRAKALKIIAREKDEQKTRDLKDNYLRLEMEEKRRLKIAELSFAKV